MTFTIKETITTKNHQVSVEAYYNGKEEPKARSKITGFGDNINRDISFDKKSLLDAVKAIELAQEIVDKVQKIADRWYQEMKENA